MTKMAGFEHQQAMCLASAKAKFQKKALEPVHCRQNTVIDHQYHG
jgi:hypothetical protein